MKVPALFLVAAFAAHAVAFTIERGDKRPFRIHGSPDETPATYEMMKELASEIRRVTGVEVEVLRYAPAFSGDFYVSTQPWNANGSYVYGERNGIIGFHGSDVSGTEAALRDFIERYVKTVPAEVGRFDWRGLCVTHGPQWADVRAVAFKKVCAERTAQNAPEWENELVNYVNVEPARAYSMPLARVEDAFTDDLPKTPYVKSLNGVWKFNWCGTPAQRPKGFFAVDFDDSEWYEIKVPCCVELQGFGVPIYTNIEYPHPPNPPKTDRDYNPVSSYRTTFAVPKEWKDRRILLRFEGVYSAYYVWVNGRKVGYSEDSCTAHEFDITPYISCGENLLAVEVYRWSDGSYLEDQDFFRYSGIYRDVVLVAVPRREIRDFHAQVDVVNGYRDATIDLTVDGAGPVSASLYDVSFEKVCDVMVGGRTVVKGARLWSAEKPNLYTLVMTNGNDIRSCKIGFRKIETAPSGAILVNGQKVKFKGVNRHDASAENGRSVTHDEMLRDVELMKRHNIDTVRTAHYPNDPYFYHLCSRYGIYVQAEANVESHGMGYGLSSLASAPSWVQAYVDRCRNMVINWRNEPCVFSWSWGNEAGQGPVFDEITRACRPLEPMLPMQYRQDCERFSWDGPGYPSREHLQGRGRWSKTQFLFEYAHSMGNALGGFKEYWDDIYASDSLIGGCIWDWIDQAVWKNTDRLDADGTRMRYLAYGGDFDDKNDGNFCCNGLLDAQRRVTPKLKEVAHVHRNLVVTRRDDGTLDLWNRFSFTRADVFEGRWELLEDGEAVCCGTFETPPVEPLSHGDLQLCAVDDSGRLRKGRAERLLNVFFSLKEDTLWAKRGWVVARDQIPLDEAAHAVGKPPSGNVRILEDAQSVTVLVAGTKAVFSRKSGTISEFVIGGRVVMKDAGGIVHGPRLTCMRALTDNDIWLRGNGADPVKEYGCGNIYQSGLTQLRYHVRSLKAIRAGVRADIDVNGSKGAGFVHVAEYTFAEDGSMTIDSTATPFGHMPVALPRLGLSMRLEPRFENLSYYGRGPWENYIDRCSGAFLGIWRSTVTDQYVDYVRPQDNGYRTDVRWAELTGSDGSGVRITASSPYFLQALHYTWEDLEFARHRARQQRIWNMKAPRAEVCLNVDLRQLGLGGASCGPKPESPYIFPVQKEKWSMTFSAVDQTIPRKGNNENKKEEE